MNCKKIIIAKDFSSTPAGRYNSDGPDSGQRFRDEILIKCLNESDQVEVWLDGTAGYGSSFLEEAFGGLIREHGFTENDLKKRLKIKCQNPEYETFVKEALEYIADQEKRRIQGKG